MARIQWTPIVAPDIGDQALRAQQLAGQSLQQAFGGLTGLLDQWEGSRREDNLRALYERQNAFAAGNDVQGYTADLADGDLLGDLKYLRAADIANARGYTNELRSGRNAEFQYGRGVKEADRSDFLFNRGETERAAGIEIQRGLFDLEGKLETNQITREEYNQLAAPLLAQAANADQIGNIREGRTRGVNAFQSSETFRRGARNSDFDYETSVENRQWAKEDRTDVRAAAAAIENIRALGGTWQDLEASDAYQNANPQQKILMRQGFGGDTSISVGSFSGSADLNNQQAEVAAVFERESASPAVIAGFLGNFEVEGGYGGALGDGGTASGIAQWRGERRAAFRQRYGRDPHQASATQQAEFAVWELTTPEGRRVAGISKENADRILNARTPGEAAELIDRFYERSDGRHRSRRVQAAERFAIPSRARNEAVATQAATNASTRTGTDGLAWTTTLPAAFADTSSFAEVAARATSTEARGDEPASPLAGQDPIRVQRELRNVQARYQRLYSGRTLSPAAALEVLEQAATAQDPLRDTFSFNRRGLNSGRGKSQLVVDNGSVDRFLRQIVPDAQGNISGLASTITRIGGNNQDIADSTAAAQLVETKRAAFVAAQEAARRNRIFSNNPVLDRAERELLEAQREFDAIEARARARQREATR